MVYRTVQNSVPGDMQPHHMELNKYLLSEYFDIIYKQYGMGF